MQKRPKLRRYSKMTVLAGAASLVTALAACSSSPVGGSSTGATSLTTVTVALPTQVPSFLPIYVGQYEGYYRRAGLQVNVVTIPSKLEPQALVGGKVDFVGSMGFLINAVAGHPAQFPIKVLAVCGDKAPFLMVGGPGITSISQLRGKVIAGDTPTSQPDLFADSVLQQHGIQPGQYSIINVSDAAAPRWALVQAGRASATMVDPNDPVLPPVKGHPILATGATVPALGCGVAATTSYTNSHPAVVRAFVAATVAASHAALTNEAQAVDAMQKGLVSLHFGYTQSQWQQAWQLSKFIWTGNGLPSSAAEQFALTSAQQQDKLSTEPTADSIFDFRYVPKTP